MMSSKDKIHDMYTGATDRQPNEDREKYIRWLETEVKALHRGLTKYCEDEILDCEIAVKEVTDGSEQVFEGRSEFAGAIIRNLENAWYRNGWYKA